MKCYTDVLLAFMYLLSNVHVDVSFAFYPPWSKKLN